MTRLSHSGEGRGLGREGCGGKGEEAGIQEKRSGSGEGKRGSEPGHNRRFECSSNIHHGGVLRSSSDFCSACWGESAPLRTEKKYTLPLRSWSCETLSQLLRPTHVFAKLTFCGDSRGRLCSTTSWQLTHQRRIPLDPERVCLTQRDKSVC